MEVIRRLQPRKHVATVRARKCFAASSSSLCRQLPFCICIHHSYRRVNVDRQRQCAGSIISASERGSHTKEATTDLINIYVVLVAFRSDHVTCGEFVLFANFRP